MSLDLVIKMYPRYLKAIDKHKNTIYSERPNDINTTHSVNISI